MTTFYMTNVQVGTMTEAGLVDIHDLKPPSLEKVPYGEAREFPIFGELSITLTFRWVMRKLCTKRDLAYIWNREWRNR